MQTIKIKYTINNIDKLLLNAYIKQYNHVYRVAFNNLQSHKKNKLSELTNLNNIDLLDSWFIQSANYEVKTLYKLVGDKKVIFGGRHTIYCYDINTKNIVSSTSLQQLKRDMNVKFTRGCTRNLLVFKQYILSRSKQELMQKISKYNEKIQIFNSNGCSKLTVDMKNDIINNNISESEFLTKYNVCKSTYYHYKQKLSEYIK